jgi:predicted  nucleic acid-binding Zn-ribbon protein
MKKAILLLVLTLLISIPALLTSISAIAYANDNCWSYHADGISLTWTTPKISYSKDSLKTQMRIQTDETVRDLSVWFTLWGTKGNGDPWSQVYLIVESPTLHTLSTEIHVEVTWPPAVGGSTTTTYTFSELPNGVTRDGIIDITLPTSIDSGPIMASITATWKVNRGLWVFEDWQEKQVPYQYTMTIATYVADLNESLKELQQNYTGLKVDFSTVQNSYISLQQSFTTLQTNFNNLQNTLKELQQNYTGLKVDFSTVQNSYISLQQSFTTLQTNFNNQQSDYRTLQAKYDDLEGEYKTVQSSYNTQTSAYGNLSKEFDDIKASREALSMQNSNLNDSLTSLQNSYKELQVDYEALQNQNIQSNDSKVQQLTNIVIAIIIAIAAVTAIAIICRRKKQ